MSRFRRRLYLLRHADVTYFEPSGRPVPPNAVPLNEHGIEQAQAAAEALCEVSFDRVITSDLPRTQQTAEVILQKRSTSPTIESTASLREIQPGRLADFLPEEAEQAFRDAFGAKLAREEQFLGGETYGSFLDRVMPIFQNLLNDKNWSSALMVAHGGVNRVILLGVMGLGLSSLNLFEQDPACINILDFTDEGDCLIRLVNHTPYNDAKVGLSLTTMERLLLQYQGRG